MASIVTRVKVALATRTKQPTEVQKIHGKTYIAQASGLGLIVLYNILLLALGITVVRNAWWSVFQPLFEEPNTQRREELD